MSDNNIEVQICHLVVQGSSEWVIDRNATRACDVLHFYGSKILMPLVDGFRDSIAICDDCHNYCVPLNKFLCNTSQSAVLTGNTAAIVPNNSMVNSWSQLKRVVDKVHRHTCAHS